MSEQAHFVSIPLEVLRANVPDGAKLLYGSLVLLSTNDRGYCYASNGFLAERHGAKKDTVSRWVADLERVGLIRVEVQKEEANQRRIFISDILSAKMPIAPENEADPIGKNPESYRQKSGELSAKMHIPIGKNPESYRQKCRTEYYRE